MHPRLPWIRRTDRLVCVLPPTPEQRSASLGRGILLTCISALGLLMVLGATVVLVFPSPRVAFVVTVCPMLSVVLAGVLGTLVAQNLPRRHVVRPGVVASGRWWLRRRRPDRLTLSGDPGFPIVFRAGDHVWMEVEPALEEGWTVASVAHFAAELQVVAGIPVVDERPLDRWKHWETDPDNRAWCAVDRLLVENQARFPGLHAIPAVEPRHDLDPAGVTFWLPVRGLGVPVDTDTALTLDHREIRIGRTTVAVDDIVRVYRYFKTLGGDRIGFLAALTRSRGEVVLARVHPGWDRKAAGLLNGTPAAIMAHLPHHVPPTGTEADIPEALTRLRTSTSKERE